MQIVCLNLRFEPDCIPRDKREDTTGAQRHHKCMNIVPHVSSLAHGPLAFHVACIVKCLRLIFYFRNPLLQESHFALKKFYHAMNDHFQERIENYNSSTEVSKECYTDLLSNFLEVFLLTPRYFNSQSTNQICINMMNILSLCTCQFAQ